MRWMLALLVGMTAAAHVEAAATIEIVGVRKIWAEAPHSAFTDLVRWHDRFWCVFREASAHVGGNDGVIRVLTSADGDAWESAAVLREEGVDLRDPKVSVTPDGRLMLLMGGSVYGGTKILKELQPRVAFSKDGKTWDAPRKVLATGDWLWRATWHEGVCYGVSYRGGGKEWETTLYRSRDGVAWEKVVRFDIPGQPNETTLRVLKDGRMVALVRREGGSKMGWVGVAPAAPFDKWKWKELQHRLGGPEFMQLPDGRMLAATREHGAKTTTGVGWLTESSFEPIVTLPSGGDTSYAGMAYHDGLVWVSYYSSHEGKGCIYLARLKVGG